MYKDYMCVKCGDTTTSEAIGPVVSFCCSAPLVFISATQMAPTCHIGGCGAESNGVDGKCWTHSTSDMEAMVEMMAIEAGEL